MSELTTLQILTYENEVKDIAESIMALHKSYKTVMLSEAIDSFLKDDADLDFMFDEAKKRFDAARRGLKLANKLGDPAQKSRVLSNLNRLRAIFNKLEKAVNNTIQMAQQTMQNKNEFQPRPSVPGIKDTFRPSPREVE